MLGSASDMKSPKCMGRQGSNLGQTGGPSPGLARCTSSDSEQPELHAAHLCLSKKRSTDGSVSPVSMPVPRICSSGKRQRLPAASNRCMCNRRAQTHLQVAAAVGACWFGCGPGLAHCRAAQGCQRVRLRLAPSIQAGVYNKVADVLVSAQLEASPGYTSNLEVWPDCHRAVAGPSRHGSPDDLVPFKQSQLTIQSDDRLPMPATPADLSSRTSSHASSDYTSDCSKSTATVKSVKISQSMQTIL